MVPAQAKETVKSGIVPCTDFSLSGINRVIFDSLLFSFPNILSVSGTSPQGNYFFHIAPDKVTDYWFLRILLTSRRAFFHWC
jgi:hypothetical protein